MDSTGPGRLTRARPALFSLCLVAVPALGLTSYGVTDVPLRERSIVTTRISLEPRNRGGCRDCSLFQGPQQVPQLAIRGRPANLVFNILLRLDDYFFARGRAPAPSLRPGTLRLSLVAPESPLSFVNRDPQDLESLSLYVLELPELGVRATARQQSRGGFWGDLAVGEHVSAEMSGLLTRSGPRGSGAYWFATHQLAVRTRMQQVRAEGAPAVFAFLSLENDLSRDLQTYLGLSVLPGAGLGLGWRSQRDIRVTMTTGGNAGLWLAFDTGAPSPGYSLNLQTVRLEF